MLAYGLSGDAPEKQEAALNAGTRRLKIEMMVSMNESL